jgi:hypothetical protein
MRRIMMLVALTIVMAVAMWGAAGPVFATVSTEVSPAACANSQDHSYISGKTSQNPKTGPQNGWTGSGFGVGDGCFVTAPVNGE